MLFLKTIPRLLILSIMACVLVTGCSKRYDYERLATQYKHECFGDMTVECRDMQIRLAISAEKANLEMLEKHKEKYVQCRGGSDYEELRSLFSDHIAYLEDLRPGFFKRHVLSSMEIELPQDDFSGNSRMSALAQPSCHGQPTPRQGDNSDDKSQSAAAPEPASERKATLANQVQSEQPVAASAATAIPATANPVVMQTVQPDATSTPLADGPAARRCGWIENDMPSSLTLQDRDGTWQIVGVSSSGSSANPDGFEQMPPTNKGDSCGCLTVQTNKQAMQVVKILGGALKSVAACQNDKSLPRS